MRVLFLTPYLPSPACFGAQRRLEGLIRGLASSHDVSVVSFTGAGADLKESVRATREYCRELVLVPHNVLSVDARTKRWMQLRSLASFNSFEHALMRRAEFQRRLDSLLEIRRYDVVAVEFAQMAAYDLAHAHASGAKTLLDEHNIEYDLVKRTGAQTNEPLRKLYSAANWRKLKREERAAWRRFDGVTLTSERDERVLLSQEPSTRTAVVPNAVDLEAFQPSRSPCEQATLLFVGAMNYHPNVDGMRFFVDEVLPQIQARHPQVRLQIVGMNPPDSILARRSPSIEVTGFVKDPMEYLRRATAVIVPLRVGGGTRLKIVEAMGAGKAIVSTALGAEGIAVVHGEHALLADDSASFADAVCTVLEQPALRAHLGWSARLLAERRYGWKTAVTRFEEFCQELKTGRHSASMRPASVRA